MNKDNKNTKELKNSIKLLKKSLKLAINKIGKRYKNVK
jgi:hypothetical protein